MRFIIRQLFIPANYNPATKYPLVLFLHGAGERGTDNRLQLTAHTGPLVFVSDANQSQHPCFMLAPQCPRSESWEADPIPETVMALLDQLGTEFSLDPDRLHVTGLSSGGFGTWALITRHPDRFASAVPMSGSGSPELASRVAQMPLWFFHAANDGTVGVSRSRDCVTALRAAGGNPIYTEYQTGGHVIWTPAYNTPGFADWVLAQQRGFKPGLPPSVSITNHLQTTDWAGVRLTLQGTASDGNNSVSLVTWVNSRGGTGTALGSNQWSASDLRMVSLVTNRITVTGQGTSWSAAWGGFTTFSETFDVYAPACLPPPPGIVRWWRAEGTPEDAFNGADGLIEGGLGFLPGKAGLGFSFNGTDAAIRIPSSPSLDVGAGAGLTLEGWIRPASVQNPQPLAQWDNAGGMPGAGFWISADDGLAGAGPGSIFADLTDLSGVPHRVSSPPGLILAGEFQHVAVTYERASGDAALLIGGVVVAQANLGSFALQTAADLHLGLSPGGSAAGARFAGVLDEFALYNRALSTAEVAAIVAAASAGKCPPVPIPAGIVTQPQPRTVFQGDTVTFSVTASGTPPFGYRWRRNGATIVPFGEGTSTLTLTNVQPAQAGTYSVVVTNATKLGGVLSASVSLSVLVDSDGDRLPDTWEVAYGFDAQSSADADGDKDGDTMSNRQEYLAGTNPTNILSFLKFDLIQLVAGGGETVLGFLAVSNRTYALDARVSTGSGAWVRVADVPAAVTNRSIEIRDPMTPDRTQRFYLLSTRPVP